MKKNNYNSHLTSLVKNTAFQTQFFNKEEKYRALIENSIHAFFLTASDGSVLESNAAAGKMFGYTVDEFKRLKKWHFIDFKDPDLSQALQQEETTGFTITEATGIKKNGVRFSIEMSSSVFKDIKDERMNCIMITDISFRKKTEADMRLSNERYNLVVKATKDLVWDWDLITNEIYRNNSNLSDVYGHYSNDFIKNIKDWLEYIHPDDREKIEEKITYYKNSAVETGFNFEYRFRRLDGTYVYINDKGYLIRNEEGKVIRMIGAAEDITERKQSALAIEESEQRYKMFLKQSSEGIWRIELTKAININSPLDKLIHHCYNNAYIAECNDAFAKMYGFANAENIIGTPLNKILPDSNPVNREYMIKFFANGFNVQNELSYETDREGNQLIFINNMVGIVENEFLKRAWGTQRNITGQKMAEARLKASEEKYRYLFNNNPSSIIIWDLDTFEILEANETAIELYGYSAEEFMRLNVLDLRPAEDRSSFIQFAENTRKHRSKKETFSWKHLTKNGSPIIIEITSHLITYRNRNAVLALGNNITEKVQLENSLNEERQIRQKQITEAVICGQEKERKELGEELHDNINQILASTKLYIECALKDKNPRADLIKESKALLEKAMKEIRILSKSLLPPSLGEVGLLQALQELIENIKQVNKLQVDIQWNETDEDKISAKLKLTIFRIIQEQLNNVMKHAEAKNVIISINNENEKLTVSIKDNGLGFNTSLKKNGVGLRNICSRAEVNKGTVSIISQPGEGCELQVIFPVENYETVINI